MDKTRAHLALLILGLVAVVGIISVGVFPSAWGIPDDRPDPKATDGDAPRSKPAAGTAAGATSREEIAKGHSRQQHQVRLRFGCETLRYNAARVWKHMKLRVRIADAHDFHLAECSRPDRPSTVSLPVDVTQIAITAPGYKRKVVPTPPTYERGGRPTTVLLEPDALVRVRAQNLPAAPGSRFTCSARLAIGVDGQGDPILGGRVSYRGPAAEASRGALVWELKIPSGVPAMFDVAKTGTTPGDRSGFLGLESPVVTLAPGEERDIILDLLDSGVLEGQVTGVAPQALEGQVLSLKIVDDAKRFGTGSDAGQILLDAKGRFRVVGLVNQQVALRLRTEAGGSPALQEVGSGRRQWRAGDVQFVVVEPEVAVHGVVPAKGGRILDRPFRVQTGGPPDGRSRLERKIPLFTHEKLQQAPLFFLVAGIGHFQRNLAGKLPDPDGLYRVEVPAPGGSLTVLVENQPHRGAYLLVRPAGGSGAYTGKTEGNSWRFEGLAPGDYQLLISHDTKDDRGNHYHSSRVVAKTVAVRSAQETKITVRMPEVLEIPGQVTNWSDTKTSTAPGWLRLHHGGQPHNARINSKGAFKFRVLGPWEGARELTFYGRSLLVDIKTTDVTWLPGRKRLLVTFPVVRERAVLVRAVAGGRMSAHVYPGGSHRGRQLRARKGRILIPELPAGVDGILCEQVHRNRQQLRLLRGWFRVAAGGAEEVQLSLKGRFIQVAMAKADHAATLTLKPPAWWQHPPFTWAALRVTGTEPRQLWLPDGATAVIVDGKQEIPVPKIGNKLVLD
ncbi:MAG: hypothetical protein ACYTGW_04435 [Planctomycetota bacterium]